MNFENRFAIISHDLFGFIDNTGSEVIPCQFRSASDFRDGYSIVQKSERWGLVDIRGEFIEFENRLVLGPSEGRLVFRGLNIKEGILDLSGGVVCPAIYDSIGLFNEGFAIVKSGDMFGVIDVNGNLRLPIRYAWLSPFSQHLAPASNMDGLYGYIDRNGNVPIPFMFLKSYNFSEDLGMILSKDSSQFGFININGEMAIPPTLEWADSFTEGLAIAAVEMRKIGFIDRSGYWIVSPAFRNASRFTEGLSAITTDEDERAWGYIDRNGNLTIPEVYTEAKPFANGLALVHGGSRNLSECWSAYINQKNEIVWGPGNGWYP